MKILYLHRTSASDGGGVHIQSLIKALREIGLEVVLIAPAVASSDAGGTRLKSWIGSIRRRLPAILHELAELALNIPECWRLLQAVRRHKPDLIYERANLFLLSGSWVARREGIPLIREVNAPYVRERSRHGGLALPRLAAWAEVKAWRSADAVIAVTGVLADIIAEAGVGRDRLHVMPNGVDSRIFSRAAIDPDAKSRLGLTGFTVLGFTGYVRDWNGLDVAINLLARPDGQQLFVLVVGDGPARAPLEAQAARLGVSARLRFTGVVERDKIPSLVSSFDIAIQPAANPYASPLKLFEYMALARAIVAPDQPNIREVLEDGRSAILFRPGDPESFAAAVMRLAGDASLRARLANCSSETVGFRDFTWRRNAERVKELAYRLCANTDRRLSPGQGNARESM